MYQIPRLRPEAVLIYLRKSRQDDDAMSVEEVLQRHEQMLDEWCQREFGGLVPQENRFREVVSGETIDARPQVQRVLRMVESPQYKAILIKEPQRLSRGDLEDAGKIIKILRFTKTIVLTPGYCYDLQDERDREDFARELKRGNEFLEYQKRIMNAGRLLSVENGNFIGQIAPYGYQKTEFREGKRICHSLEPDEEKAPIVRKIFEMYASGIGSTRICEYLDSIGAPPPRGQHWSPPGIMSLLRNEHYIGKVVWNRRKTTKTIQGGELIISRPRYHSGEYLVYDGKHPAIVDEALFSQVQRMLGYLPRNKKTTNFSNPLRGLIFCTCGRAMSRRTYTRAGSSVQRSSPRLLCEGQRFCHTPSAVLQEVLDKVKEVLKETIRDFNVQLRADNSNEMDMQQQTISRLEKRMVALEEQELRQWRELTAGTMPHAIFDQLNAELVASKEQVSAALETARTAVPARALVIQKRATFQNALDALNSETTTAFEQGTLLQECISRITYSCPPHEKHWNSRSKTRTPRFTLDIQLKI